ncbi:hypothetical protein BB021_10990 [Elizabethkingia ursingii]|uniref:Transposase n=1 Tax=Elizabethkingia ursingii TaxID=1756150 RepID=A0ABX3N6G8_9FLAO|nr:hypothetical protein BB021_10990 [Elizabethkingia ursingii]
MFFYEVSGSIIRFGIYISTWHRSYHCRINRKKYPDSTMASIKFNPPEYQWKIADFMLFLLRVYTPDYLFTKGK